VPFSRLFPSALFAITALALAVPAIADEVVAMNAPLPAAQSMTPQALTPSLTAASKLKQKDLWERIRSGFAMADMDNRLVDHYERWYADRPDYVARMTERARRYLFYIVGEVEKRGMPTEIALLPMIESAFNPTANSVSNASGIWQFIPSTGKHFGLQQNWWHDERRDVISATNSALDYLQSLHDQFGDWELALAAYNWGENAVERAQAYNRRHHRPTDYEHLRMPLETRHYVPKLLAVKNIISDPQKFGLALQPIPNQPYFAEVIPPYHMDVKVAAQLADIPMDEFLALNPEHNRPVILQDNATPILLPVNKIETFMTNVDIYDQPLVSWQPYQPKKGERLDKLARQFDIPLDKLRSANGLPPYAKTSNGQKLLVPADTSNGDLKNDFEAFNTNLPPTLDYSHAIVHVVRHGETLGGIARHYHVSIASLKSHNHNSTLIHPGQRLVVVGGSAAAGRHVRLAKNARHRGRHARKGSDLKVASNR
jgi:membrane-bound lytic murein transglycosylase D